MVKIRFLGACREVTGSMHLLDTGKTKILLDCGMRQGVDSVEREKHIPFDPSEIDYIILSHAHIDHSGLIPYLYLRGFRGRVVTTTATRAIAELLLLDSAKIMKEEYEKSNIPPLFDERDVVEVMSHFDAYPYNKPVRLQDVKLSFLDAGHILGSAVTLLRINGLQICYTGDIGSGTSPLMNPPTPPKEADVLIMESTYGNRRHEDRAKAVETMKAVISDTIKAGGKVLIPVFAVGRAQEVLYVLRNLRDKIRVKVYLDTPLGSRVTDIYKSYSNMLRKEFYELFLRGKNPIEFEGLEYVTTYNRSRELAKSNEPCIILSASGMLEGGRVLNHLPYILQDENSTVLFVGYQAEGTLGRQIVDGNKLVYVNGDEVDVRCNVVNVSAFSAHADEDGLVGFVEGMDYYPRRIYIVHGEEEAARNLLARLPKVRKSIPERGEEADLGWGGRAGMDGEREGRAIIDFKPGFVDFMGLSIHPEPLLLVREGEMLILRRYGEVVGELMSAGEELAVEIRAAVKSAEVEKISVEAGDIARLREFMEAGILSKKLSKEIVCTLLKEGRDEVIRMLHLKRDKDRFPVKDPEVVNDFVEYMVNLLKTRKEVEIVAAFEELIPKISGMCY